MSKSKISRSIVQTSSSNVIKADNNHGFDDFHVGIDPLYKPYCCTGILTRPDCTTRSVTLLWDTGALQSLLNHNMISDNDYIDAGERRFVRDVSGEVVPVPLAEVTLQ